MPSENEKEFIAFICTQCHQEIEASPDTAGQQVECPACGARLTVPTREQAPTPAQLNAMKSRTIRIELPDL